MRSLGVALATLASLAVVGAVAAALFVYFGVYNVAATHPHTQVAYWVMQTAAVRSIHVRAKDVTLPDLSRADARGRGLDLFQQHCVLCHGAPGIAPADFAKGLEPGAPPLAQTAKAWETRDLYWAIRHGIKMTAMPAWEFRLADEDIWAIVALLRLLPTMSPAEYRRMVAERARPVSSKPEDTEQRPGPGDPDRGRTALHQYACNMCHEIPGISGPRAVVGPSLDHLAARPYIAGVLENTPADMIRWIRHPQSVSPQTAMPDMGVTEAHARDMVAYLSTLR